MRTMNGITDLTERISKYPPDVQDLLRLIVNRWNFPTIPQATRKGGGAFGMWIKELRYIKNELILNRDASEVISWSWNDYLRKPREVSHPGALNSLIFDAIRTRSTLVQVETKPKATTPRNDAQKPIPAPSWVKSYAEQESPK